MKRKKDQFARLLLVCTGTLFLVCAYTCTMVCAQTQKNINAEIELVVEQLETEIKEKKEKKGTTMEQKIFEYTVKEELKPAGLVGISDEQINDHWKLYVGYVNQVNGLNKELRELAQAGKVGTLAYADRRRRYGFEYNGMVLHEYYFGNLKAKNKPLATGSLRTAIEQTWGSFEAWQADFIATGKTRGIGWAILYLDPQTRQLTNHFIAEHQNGNIAGFKPLLVMDVWEHAYMVDHQAGGRGDYITAFLQNVDWEVVQARFN